MKTLDPGFYGSEPEPPIYARSQSESWIDNRPPTKRAIHQ